MDKTLEIVMVAVALVVAVVIVTGILQGRAGTFGNFADSQTNSSSCSIATSQFENAVNCPCTGGSCTAGPRATAVFTQNQNCFSAGSASDAKSNYC